MVWIQLLFYATGNVTEPELLSHDSLMCGYMISHNLYYFSMFPTIGNLIKHLVPHFRTFTKASMGMEISNLRSEPTFFACKFRLAIIILYNSY